MAGLTLQQLQQMGAKPATTTGGLTLDQIKQKQSASAPMTTQPKKEDGFFKGLVKDVAETLVVKPVARATELATRTFAPNSFAAQGYREGGDMNVLGMNIEGQKAFGQGGLKQIVGEAAKTGSYLYGGGATANVAKSTIGGKILQGAWQGAKGGAIGGALYGGGEEIQQEDATVGSVAKQTALGGAIGGVAGGVLGGALPVIPALIKGAKPEKIMQRVARVNALDQEKFAKTANQSIGQYLVDRGIYGNDDEIVNQLATRFTSSKNVADEALAKLQGNWKNGAVEDALSDLAERETRVSSKNVPSQSLGRVTELSNKHKTQGLTMQEINEVKRLYERNVKLGYLKERNTDMVARSTGIDDAIRTWQFSQADKLGLKNLQGINKETQLARMLGDALLKKNARSGGNNAFGLTDAILISGGDPQAISMLLAKKTFGSKGVQSAIAKKLAPEAKVGTPTAIFGKRASNKEIFPSTIIPNGESSFGTLNLGKKPVSTGGTSVSIPVKEAKTTLGSAKPKPQQLLPKVESVSLPPTLPPKPTKSSKGLGTVKLTPKETNEGKYLYHGTGEQALEGIVKDGLKPQRRGVSSFSKDESYSTSFAESAQFPPKKGSGVMLRVNTELLKGKTVTAKSPRPKSDELNEVLTKEVVPPEALEIKVNGKWQPLTQKKGLGTVLPDKLTTEARKYKSAENIPSNQMIQMAKTSKYRFSDFESDMSGNRLFHGTADDFKEFDMSMVGKTHQSDFGKGIYLTPDEGLANAYRRSAVEGTDKKGVVKELYIDPEAKVKNYYEGQIGKDFAKAEDLQKQGYDAIYAYRSDGKLEEVIVMNPKVLYTSDQLTDIWNKANRKATTLLEEAKKYKSAEEFVKAQGTPVYHGTKSNIGIDELSSQANSRGQYLGDGIYFTKYKEGADLYGGKTLEAVVNDSDFLDISKLKGVDRTKEIGSLGTYKQYLKNNDLVDSTKNFDTWSKNQKNVSEKVIKMGYKGITDGQQHVIFDKTALKTKSQLTDIWNKANRAGEDLGVITVKKKDVPLVKDISDTPSKKEISKLKKILERAGYDYDQMKKDGFTDEQILKALEQ